LKKKAPAKGLGDSIKNALDLLSRGKAKPCGGCKKRQEKLNEMFPYRRTDGCKGCKK
jgi:hypothetical protein